MKRQSKRKSGLVIFSFFIKNIFLCRFNRYFDASTYGRIKRYSERTGTQRKQKIVRGIFCALLSGFISVGKQHPEKSRSCRRCCTRVFCLLLRKENLQVGYIEFAIIHLPGCKEFLFELFEPPKENDLQH